MEFRARSLWYHMSQLFVGLTIFFVTANIVSAEDMRKILEHDKYLKRGKALASRNMFKEALVDFNKAVAAVPTPGAYTEKCLAHYFLKDYGNALKACNKAISLDENYDRAYAARGHVYGVTGKMKEAKNDFQKGCQLGSSLACEKMKNFQH